MVCDQTMSRLLLFLVRMAKPNGTFGCEGVRPAGRVPE